LAIRSLTGDDEFTIPITQIGLKFDNAVLKEEDIRAANAALNQHLQHSITSHAQSGTEPIIISRKGVGRNATLIVYHDILPLIRSGQITSDADLDTALQRVIVEGRKARSIHFVHSARQLQELRNALRTEMGAQRDR
jgi:protein tyrosine phosphatase